MGKAKLTGKQRAFINEYFKCRFNATRAAINAGYSKKTAYSIGHENLNKPEIKAAIEDRLNHEALGSNELIRLLADHATGSMDDFVDEAGYINLEVARAKGKMHLVHSYKHITTDEQERIEVKLYDAQSALKELIKLYRLDDDKPTDNITIRVEYDDYNPKTS